VHDIGTILVCTVDSNKSKYIIRQYSLAKKACELQDIIGKPSTEDFIKYIEGNMIPSCNITRQDILRAEDIFGPNLRSVKGKTTRHPTSHINVTWKQVPEDILQKYGSVTLAIDIMAINKLPFMVSTSGNIHFGTAEIICDKTKWTLNISIQQIMQAYHARGFRVTTILLDGGFECIRNNLAEMGISLNIMSRNEHVPKVERYIRTIKERVWAIAVSLPFKKYLPRLIMEMVYNVMFGLNSLPHNDGISPRTLITGLAIDYHKHCKIGFGTYAQVHEEGDNSLRQRTSGAIAL